MQAFFSFRKIGISIGVAALVIGAQERAASDEIKIHAGQKIAFLGDSITQYGWMHAGGYVHLVVLGLKANGILVEPLPAGVSGNTSRDMLARLQRVLDQKPDWMTLSCGVNDISVAAKAVPLDEYKANVTSIVDRARAAGVEVMILTATPIQEDLRNGLNRQEAAYNDFLRSFAAERNCALADVNADAQAAILAGKKPGRVLTVDGTHMNPHGDEMLAARVLRGLGLTDEQLQKAREAWAILPDAWSVPVRFPRHSDVTKQLALIQPLSRGEYERLEAINAAQGAPISVVERLNTLFGNDVQEFLAPKGPYPSVDAILLAHKEQEVLDQVGPVLQRQIEALLAGADAG